MKKELEVGIIGESKFTVTEEMTAKKVGSGDSLVLSTPYLVAWMENAAKESVKDYIDDDKTTVGVEINIRHVAATPVGMTAYCKSELIYVDKNALIFTVEAFDEKGEIGQARHTRYIVNSEKFQQKADSKLGEEGKPK